MKFIQRNYDVISEKKDLEHLYTFKNFPIFMGTTNQQIEEDIKFDMNWYISSDTGCIQLNPLLPLELLYANEHGSGCVGEVWLKHHQSFSKFIRSINPRSVLEIGGGHGILSKLYHKDSDINWTIIEPNPIPHEELKAKLIKGFFDDNFKIDEEYDAIVHSHVFEHVYEPQTFMQNIKKFLPIGKHLIFSVPNMNEMLIRKYNNCLNFEHTYFLVESYIEYLLSKHSFKIIKKEYFLEDHSIFYACIHDTNLKAKQSLKSLYKVNKYNFLNYIEHYENLIKNLNRKIIENQNKNFYLFGAHIFSQFLISFGLDTKNIKAIIDNDPSKHDKRLYGTNLTVRSPKILKDIKDVAVILKAGVYNNEIKNDILKNINSNTIFLE